MSDYTTKDGKVKSTDVDGLITKVLGLPRKDRIVFLQKIFFAIIKYDNSILISLLRKKGVKISEIGKELGLDESIISREFPLEGTKSA